jgi:hypothetical protein
VLNHLQFADILNDNGLAQFTRETDTRGEYPRSDCHKYTNTVPKRVDVIPGVSDHDIVYCEIDVKPIKLKQSPMSIPLYAKTSIVP